MTNVDDFLPNKDPRLAPIVDRIQPGWGKWVSTGPGWYDLLIQLDKDLAAIDPDYELYQVKEKFGGLRYYAEHHHGLCEEYEPTFDDEGWRTNSRCRFDELIREATDKSFVTCEECGEPGTINEGYWLEVRCENHKNERDKN